MKLLITILLLTSLTTYGQRVIIHDLSDSAFIQVTGGKVEFYKGKVTKGVKAIDTMHFIIDGVVQQPPAIKSELCRFVPFYYKDLIQSDGAVTAVQSDTKVESTRKFEDDGEITFKFNIKDSVNGAIASITGEDWSLGLRFHRDGGKYGLSFVVNGSNYITTRYTGSMVSTKYTYKIKRNGPVVSFHYSPDGKTFTQFGTAGGYLLIGDAWFTGFITAKQDGFANVAITADKIKNK